MMREGLNQKQWMNREKTHTNCSYLWIYVTSHCGRMSKVGQWIPWDKPPVQGGTVGFHGTIPPVLDGTVGMEGHIGLSD